MPRTDTDCMREQDLIDRCVGLFRRQFPDHCNTPLFYGIAPGRVEILGNHTDYNEGFVLSAAIDLYTVVVGTPIEGETVFLISDRMDSEVRFGLRDTTRFPPDSPSAWANYSRGVILELNPPTGFVAVACSTVPVGAGVSSSAALELATAFFIQRAFPVDSIATLSGLDLALMCKKAENDFVGVGCGILDQVTSALGKEGQLMLLDCRNINAGVSYVTLPTGFSFVVVESDAPHQLVSGKYNELRTRCFKAAELLGYRTLRDVSRDQFDMRKSDLPEKIRKAAEHIVGENYRVLKAVEVITNGSNMGSFGHLLSESHHSSQYDFGNSCPEIDILIACASSLPGFLGGRIQGGGFGGSTINLVESSMVEMFRDLVTRAYFEKTGISATSFVVNPAHGALSGDIESD